MTPITNKLIRLEDAKRVIYSSKQSIDILPLYEKLESLALVAPEGWRLIGISGELNPMPPQKKLRELYLTDAEMERLTTLLIK